MPHSPPNACPGSPRRIDAHHHLWRYTAEEYGWIGDDMSVLRRDFLLRDLSAVTAAARVDGTVAVQARQTVEETRWLLELAEQPSPIKGVVGWLPIAAQDFESTLQEFLPRPALKGLRHVVQAETPGFLDGDAFNGGVRVLADTGLVYDILILARQLQETTRFVDRHPQQIFVLDHIAKPEIRAGGLEHWEAGIRELARRENVSCKVSGMITEADPHRWTPGQLKPYFDVVLEAFTPERLMIGTDWPVLTVGCEYTQWWSTVETWTQELSETEQTAVLGGTASRVYRLDAPQDGSAQQMQTAGTWA